MGWMGWGGWEGGGGGEGSAVAGALPAGAIGLPLGGGGFRCVERAVDYFLISHILGYPTTA